jgi:hypothetical protein
MFASLLLALSRHRHVRRPIPIRGRFALRLVWAQGFLPVEGQVLALLQVRPDKAKYSVVGTEWIFDSVVAFVHRSRHPKIGAAGNGHHDSLSAIQREMRTGISGPAQFAPLRSESFGVPSPHSATPVNVSARSRNLKARETWYM